MTGPSGDLAILLDAESRFAARLDAAKREAQDIVEAARGEAERSARAAGETAEVERAGVRDRVRAETETRLDEARKAQAAEMRRYASIGPVRLQALGRFVVERLIDDLAADESSEVA